MKLEERIAKEKLKVKDEVESLRQENKTDEETLRELKGAYEESLFTEDRETIERINSEMNEVSIRIARRKTKMNVLEDEKRNPNIQNMIAEEIEKVIPVMEENEQHMLEEIQKLKDEQERIIKNLGNIQKAYEQDKRYRAFINRYNGLVSDESRKKIGLSEQRVDVINHTLAAKMRELLIREVDIFGNPFK